MSYICSNCGHIQDDSGSTGGCAHAFWAFCLLITFFIALIVPVAWIVVGFEILFFILTGGKSNSCRKCNAKDCVIPIETPKGEKIYNEYYPEDNSIEEKTEVKKFTDEEIKLIKDKRNKLNAIIYSIILGLSILIGLCAFWLYKMPVG